MASLALENIGLTYPIFHSTDHSLKTAVRSLATGGFVRRAGRRRIDVQALENISLSASDGDRIAIIGHNGAGKTSLLKVLAGIYKPQKGRIRREGKTGAVINPAIGLIPSQTGRENIETMGLLSGLSWSEIEDYLPEIEAFTELGEFLGLPVSSYSAGMRTRLAFAVATALRPEILILDENLGTGDAQFLKRAQERMKMMMDQSHILVLASHNLRTLEQFCNRGIVLQHGRIVADGPVEETIAQYRAEQAQS